MFQLKYLSVFVVVVTAVADVGVVVVVDMVKGKKARVLWWNGKRREAKAGIIVVIGLISTVTILFLDLTAFTNYLICQLQLQLLLALVRFCHGLNLQLQDENNCKNTTAALLYLHYPSTIP